MGNTNSLYFDLLPRELIELIFNLTDGILGYGFYKLYNLDINKHFTKYIDGKLVEIFGEDVGIIKKYIRDQKAVVIENTLLGYSPDYFFVKKIDLPGHKIRLDRRDIDFFLPLKHVLKYDTLYETYKYMIKLQLNMQLVNRVYFDYFDDNKFENEAHCLLVCRYINRSGNCYSLNFWLLRGEDYPTDVMLDEIRHLYKNYKYICLYNIYENRENVQIEGDIDSFYEGSINNGCNIL